MDKKSKLLEIFANHGYTSQAGLAEAIYEKGFYKSSRSVKAYLSQVINCKRSPSSNLLKALSSVCDNDLRISAILGSQSSPEEREANLTYELECKLDETYNLLKDEFIKSGSSGKMAFILDFEKYVEGKKRKR